MHEPRSSPTRVVGDKELGGPAFRARLATKAGPLPTRRIRPIGRIVSANVLQSWPRITDLRSRRVGGYPPVQAGRLMQDESQRLAEFASVPGGHREGQDMTVRV